MVHPEQLFLKYSFNQQVTVSVGGLKKAACILLFCRGLRICFGLRNSGWVASVEILIRE
jgi:hypothetical protein